MSEAYFEPRGTAGEWEIFNATKHTETAWGPDFQHGAPPAAILTRAMDRHERSESTRIARITVDLLGAVPLGEVRTRAWISRPGRRIQLVEAELAAGDRVVARASAWRMAIGDTAAVAQTTTPARQLPEQSDRTWFANTWGASGFVDSLDCREDTDGTVWARTRMPLVAGEEPTPAERVMMIADIANGVGAVLDPREWQFMNTDLVVHLQRRPQGEWIGVSAQASIGPDGVGTTVGTLFDTHGRIGNSLQALLVQPL
ncbi:thioesterase family protein [Granulicoccus phenolivorans]|uniref:thioesterase family protein n=1 Tax=Granulicoccus phenolivorans TaxID=266854 RepID=UPI00042A75F6|nr:thioesterase family protein [Granulicoccus phenolivorans]